jgi:hypothetical protein
LLGVESLSFGLAIGQCSYGELRHLLVFEQALEKRMRITTIELFEGPKRGDPPGQRPCIVGHECG